MYLEDELEYHQNRHRLYVQWLHFRLGEGGVIPFWDLRDDPEYFHRERERLNHLYQNGVGPEYPTELSPFHRSMWLRQWREDWFIDDVLKPSNGKSVDEQVRERQTVWDRWEEEAARPGTPRVKTKRRRADDEDEDDRLNRRHDEPRQATRDDFGSSEDWSRHRVEGGFTSSEDFDPRERFDASGRPKGLYATRDVGPYRPPVARPAVSDAITEKQYGNVYSAVAFAQYQSMPLNTHVVVTWSTVGVTSDSGVARAHQALLERIRKYVVETLKLPFHLIWVLERGTHRGVHSHLLMYMDAHYRPRMKKMLERAVATISGEEPLKSKELSTVFVGSPTKDKWFHFHYFMKGIFQDAPALTVKQQKRYDELVEAMTLPPKAQGTIQGKRVGISRSLDAKARAAAGFVSQWDRGCREAYDLFKHDYAQDAEIDRLMKTVSV